MLHLKGYDADDVFERMKRETEIYYEGGIDSVMVEDYFGSPEDCERAIEYLQEQYKGCSYGINLLGDYRKAFELASRYEADFVQIDSVCGHLPPDRDKIFAKELIAREAGKTFDVLGGLRFKYQPVHSGRTLEEDAALTILRCDAVVTTGEGTGIDCPTEKLAELKGILGHFPLIVGAGVTADTVEEKLQYADGVIIGSWLKEGHTAFGEVSAEYVRYLMERVRAVRSK